MIRVMNVRIRSAFVGRDRELATLGEHLGHVRAGRPQVVLVEGDPGTGKTALIEAFLDRVDADATVLRASGEEVEELLPFGIVEQLVAGAGEPVVEVRPADEPPLVGAAVVALLDRLRVRDGPILLVVDDAHWADLPSVQALVFALRRLGADRVLTLVASRPHDGGRIDRVRVLAAGERGTTLRLGGLGVDGLVALGRALGQGELPVPAAQRLLAHTGGVPLHARALFEEVDPAAMRSVDTPLPSPVSYAVLVLGRLSQCPPATRAVVAAAAVLGLHSRLADAVALAGGGGVEAVSPAVAAGLLTTGTAPDGATIGFPHALIRAAVYHDLDLATRGALHTGAAGIVGSADEALRHRVAAAADDDPVLAAELRVQAAEQVERGERSRGAATLISAAGLFPAAADRRGCLLDAVELLVLTGERSRATELVAALPTEAATAREAYVRGLLAFVSGRTAEAERRFLTAWAAANGCEPAFRADICDRLCHMYYLQMRSAESVEWGARALAVDPRHTGAFVTSLAFAGRAIPASTDRTRPTVAHGARLLWTEDHAGARAELTAAVGALRSAGMFVDSLYAQGYLALTEHRMGEWAAAVADADEAVALAEDAEQDWTLARLHSFAAMPHAARGDWARADAHIAAATTAATATGTPLDRVGATVAAAHVADARGAHATVVELLGPLPAPTAGEPGVSNWPCLLGDALVHLGRVDDAERVLAPYERRAAELGRRIAQGTAGRVRGRLHAARGDTEAAERSFRMAAAHARDAGATFDGALTALAHGAMLRRAGRRRAAADELRAARTVLDRLGARPALERCEQELAACGLAPVARTARDPGRLTPRELRVARLAASGLSNPEVAAELIVSVNTVEFHLRNAYAKLGIRSRTHLAAHLGRGPAAG